MAYSSALFSHVCFHTIPNPNPKLNCGRHSTTLHRHRRLHRRRSIRQHNPRINRQRLRPRPRCRAVPRRPREVPPAAGGGDKEVVKEYFNKSGFQRWKKIYGDTDEVNRVQLDIRIGHSKTVENVMKMLTEEGPLQGVTVCDAGCGTGCLSIPLAKEEVIVTASYISAAMVEKQGQFLIWANTFGAFGVGSAFISLASTIQSIQGFGELGVVYLWAEKWLSRSE